MRNMKAIAVMCAAAFMFATVAPAFAQPFADVPTNHWAYDAIAELAAKGLIEGYPDGTFKGDRAMTRYEMAMVVARLLARIESIQIPAPTPPGVSVADFNAFKAMTQQNFDTITRLVNEFRAELAALGVRVTAIEEELNAIKARLDNVRVTGGFRFRYDVAQVTYGSQNATNLTGTPQNIVGGTPNSPNGPAFNLGVVPVNGSVTGVGAGTAQFLQNGSSSAFGQNGNPRSSQISSNSPPIGNLPQYEFKLGFDGSVRPNIHYVIGVWTTGGFQIFNSGSIGTAVNAPTFGTQPTTSFGQNGSFTSVDSAFLDYRNAWGLPLEIRLGRFGNNTPCGTTCYPIQWGPFGLIMNDNGDTWEDSTASGGFNMADGIRINSHVPQWADLQFEAVAIRIQGGMGSPTSPAVNITPSSAYIFGEDAYGANINFQIISGLRVGVSYIGNSINGSSNTPGPGGFGQASQWHVYGPGGGSVNPGLGNAALIPNGFHCVSVTQGTGTVFSGAGIACPASGNGWDGYVDWAILPGLSFDGEYAQWNDSVFGSNDTGWKVNFHIDIGSLIGWGHPFTFDAGYQSYGQNFYPPYGAAELDIQQNDFFYPGNGNGWTGGFSITPITSWTLYFNAESGNFGFTGQTQGSYEGGIIYGFAQNASIVFKIRQAQINGVQQGLLYRAQVDYTF